MEQLGFDLGYAFDEPTTSKGGGMRIVQADFLTLPTDKSGGFSGR